MARTRTHARIWTRTWTRWTHLLGELADGLDEVAVGLGVARDGLAHAGDDFEGVKVVGLFGPGQRDVGELEAHEAPPWLEHAEGLGEGLAAVVWARDGSIGRWVGGLSKASGGCFCRATHATTHAARQGKEGEQGGDAPVRHVAEAEGDGVEVEGAVLEREALRVPLHPRQRVARPGFMCACVGRYVLVVERRPIMHLPRWNEPPSPLPLPPSADH